MLGLLLFEEGYILSYGGTPSFRQRWLLDSCIQNPSESSGTETGGESLICLVARKPVFGVSDKTSFKPVSSATESSWKIEISSVANLHMILSKKRITKALIRLCGCAGWSAPVLFANPRRQGFSHCGPKMPPHF